MKQDNKAYLAEYKLQINRGNGWGPHPVLHCKYNKHDASILVGICNKMAKRESSYYYGTKSRKVKAD